MGSLIAAAQPAVQQADTGLGTTFERWALNRCLVRLIQERGIETVLEGPGDGMTGIPGINSMVLGRMGARVSLLLPDEAPKAQYARTVWSHYVPAESAPSIDTRSLKPGQPLPYADGEFDLAWNFNVLTRQPDPAALLAEMARVSRRYVLVFVPNARNYSFGLHRLHHRVAGQPWDHGTIGLMGPGPLRRLLEPLGLRPLETIYVDCPWWPDIVDFGQLIADFFPFLKGIAGRARPENRLYWPAEALPYFEPERYPDIHRQLHRLAIFENSRFNAVKQIFAHHVGILAEKRAL